jgi:hypothetical protein
MLLLVHLLHVPSPAVQGEVGRIVHYLLPKYLIVFQIPHSVPSHAQSRPVVRPAYYISPGPTKSLSLPDSLFLP